MIDVILLRAEGKAESGRSRLFKSLAQVFSSTHTLAVLAGGRFIRQEGADLLLWETEHLHSLESPAALLILEGPSAHCPQCLPGGTVAILGSQGSLPDLPAQSGIQAISCGLQTADTLTLSSITDESAVISLQRSLVTFSGETVEPEEFPLALRGPADPFAILTAAAFYLLTDNQTLLGSLIF